MIAWTAEQVVALAPDPASVAAARGLLGRWTGTGWDGNALWGLCGGSGATPYQTVVDTSGPAYKCSCPSRKFPCKHALALLLLWSGGGVPQADQVAAFAADWIEGRAGRAAAGAGVRPTPAPQPTAPGPGPAVADKRAPRVAAGLEDLDVWLCDRVRAGLAGMDRSPAAFEAVAARLVDAQAPGVAAVLRSLPEVAAGPDWPQRLLVELAQLRLLVAAHRTVDDLPEPLAASVRRHVGYPVAAEAVLAAPGVRDRWMVLAVELTEEKRLHTRKVWLRGRGSGRWALVLDFHHGSPAFPADMPPPGSLVDAEVHYYPGAAPLRAILGRRHADPEPFTTLPADSLDAALGGFAQAVAADPWLRSWPVLLSEVVPSITTDSDGPACLLVDGAGLALPVRRSAGVPWRVVGVSGGHPVTVMGEWSVDGLAVRSVFAAGQVVAA